MVEPNTVTVDVGALARVAVELVVCIVEASVALSGIGATCALLGGICPDCCTQARFQEYRVGIGLSTLVCASVLRDRQFTIIALAALHSPQSPATSMIASIRGNRVEGLNV